MPPPWAGLEGGITGLAALEPASPSVLPVAGTCEAAPSPAFQCTESTGGTLRVIQVGLLLEQYVAVFDLWGPAILEQYKSERGISLPSNYLPNKIPP